MLNKILKNYNFINNIYYKELKFSNQKIKFEIRSNLSRKFTQEYFIEEIVGLILQNKKNKVSKLIFNIDNFYKKLIFKTIINIPLNRLIIGKIIYFKKFFCNTIK